MPYLKVLPDSAHEIPALKKHVTRWRQCQRCAIGARAIEHVYARGVVPCQALFVGEAPGNTENVVGQPFIGPAGKLLDKMITKAASKAEVVPLRYAVTNMVMCRPCDTSTGPIRPPSEEELDRCSPRLYGFIWKWARPSLIVRLGRVAQKYLENRSSPGAGKVYQICDLYHPAYILRMGGVESSVYDREVDKLAKALEVACQN